MAYTSLPSSHHHQRPPRDSLELASLASSSHSRQSSAASSPSGAASSRRLSDLSADDPFSNGNAAANAAAAGQDRPGRHNRSYSVLSAQFDFASNLFPLSTTAGAGGYTALGGPESRGLDPTRALNGVGGVGAGGGVGGRSNLERHKTLTYLNGLSLVVGLIIGSGIFSSPAQVNSNAGSPGASLLVWAVAGALAWTGAASYAELGGAMPLNGGAQAYLATIFGEWAGFLFAWDAVVVLKPGSAAIIALIFGEYVVRAAAGAGGGAGAVSPWPAKAVAVAGLLVVTLLNCVSTKLGTRSADVFMLLKFVALVGVAVMGVVVAVTGLSYEGDADSGWKERGWFEGTSTNVSQWAVALYAGLWAFDGWDNTNYVTGEFVNPGRDLPRVIHTALPLVILSYLLANLAYFFVLPPSVIESTNTVAVAFGAHVLGPVGSLLLALIVAGSCFGALNATTFTSGRLVCAAGREGYLPAVFGQIGIGERAAARLHSRLMMTTSSSSTTPPPRPGWFRRGWLWRAVRAVVADDDAGVFFTPVNAMLLNAALTAAYVVVGEFATLVTFYGVAGYSFYFATVLGLIVLRVREPQLERPYRTWISTPIIFCCVSLFLLSRAVVADPLQTLIVVAFTVAGVPVYFWRVRRVRSGAGMRVAGMGGPEPPEKGSGWKFWRRWGRG